MLDEILLNALREDIGEGDHSSLACVPESGTGVAKLLVKDEGVLAGVEVALRVFELYDPSLKVNVLIQDGAWVKPGEIAMTVEGSSRSILATERLVLNAMQRMSGIATQTRKIADLIKEYPTQLLDTRKTTPGIRLLEKWAVRIGGGANHRFALYDMIMLKDNHIDYAGGIRPAIEATVKYLKETGKDLKVEVEVRNEDELRQVLEVGQVDRIMLDNFTPAQIAKVLPSIPKTYEVEASGGITLETIKDYAATGVDFISVGALTHSFKSLDLSLKAVFDYQK